MLLAFTIPGTVEKILNIWQRYPDLFRVRNNRGKLEVLTFSDKLEGPPMPAPVAAVVDPAEAELARLKAEVVKQQLILARAEFERNAQLIAESQKKQNAPIGGVTLSSPMSASPMSDPLTAPPSIGSSMLGAPMSAAAAAPPQVDVKQLAQIAHAKLAISEKDSANAFSEPWMNFGGPPAAQPPAGKPAERTTSGDSAGWLNPKASAWAGGGSFDSALGSFDLPDADADDKKPPLAAAVPASAPAPTLDDGRLIDPAFMCECMYRSSAFRGAIDSFRCACKKCSSLRSQHTQCRGCYLTRPLTGMSPFHLCGLAMGIPALCEQCDDKLEEAHCEREKSERYWKCKSCHGTYAAKKKIDKYGWEVRE